MRKLIFGVLLALFGFVPSLHAQQSGPTIISFTVNQSMIDLAAAESETAEATFSWNTANMTIGYLLLLQRYFINNWIPYTQGGAVSLPPSGSETTVIKHSFGFGPPTYRLIIVDRQSSIVAEQILVIPYTPASYTNIPQIDLFTADVTSAEQGQLQALKAYIGVDWQVSGRTPTANLRFQQVLSDGGTIGIELPRPNLWIASAGNGVVLPTLPTNTTQQITLRLQVYDEVDGTIYDEAVVLLDVIHSEPTPAGSTNGGGQSTPAGSAGDVKLASFTAAPTAANRGDTITFTWKVEGAADGSVSISVYHKLQRFPGAMFIDNTNWTLPAEGTTTYIIPDLPLTEIQFTVMVDGTRFIDDTLTITINCPYTFMAGPVGGAAQCPEAAPAPQQLIIQPFEHGMMIWREGVIWVLFNDGRGRAMLDNWDGAPVIFDEQPPAGLEQPVRGFGHAWVADAAGFRDQIGWATAPEMAYTASMQRTRSYYAGAHYYFTLPDGRILYVSDSSYGSLEWQYLSQ